MPSFPKSYLFIIELIKILQQNSKTLSFCYRTWITRWRSVDGILVLSKLGTVDVVSVQNTRIASVSIFPIIICNFVIVMINVQVPWRVTALVGFQSIWALFNLRLLFSRMMKSKFLNWKLVYCRVKPLINLWVWRDSWFKTTFF